MLDEADGAAAPRDDRAGRAHDALAAADRPRARALRGALKWLSRAAPPPPLVARRSLAEARGRALAMMTWRVRMSPRNNESHTVGMPRARRA